MKGEKNEEKMELGINPCDAYDPDNAD